ncbi:MAG: hypothetical protein HUK16_09770, partial [Bacteroidales bacterium]|nr:hypothetical protein [Bacteroidales bacterium]
MAFWDRILGTSSQKGNGAKTASDCSPQHAADANSWAIVDVEVGVKDLKIHDIGALCSDGTIYHGASKTALFKQIENVDFLCGHNIVNHDVKYLFGDEPFRYILVDTLYMSPLLFPKRPYHNLVKDDKLVTEQLNNPVNDCQKARDLLMDEIA